MNFEKKYAQIYDEFYKDKDYKSEVTFLDQIIKRYSHEKSILEFGCGTGSHAQTLLEFGYTIDGIDRSQAMIDLAKEKLPQVNFLCSDIASFTSEKQYGVAVMMFHVFSYLSNDELLRSSLEAVSKLVKQKGIFIFDYWNTSGVDYLKPHQSHKEININGNLIKRIGTPNRIDSKRIDINFEFEIFSKDGSLLEKFNEVHPMRSFSTVEIEQIANDFGFKILEHKGWKSENAASKEDWAAYAVFQKL